MSYQPGKPRSSSVLASVLAAAGIVLTVASCSRLTPPGPNTVPQPRHLGSPIVLQVILSHPPTATGRCPAGYTTLSVPAPDPSPCYRPVGAPVTLTSAWVAAPPVAAAAQTAPPPPGQPSQSAAQSVSYVITIGVPAADVAAVTAVIKQAYASKGDLDISVAGKTWSSTIIFTPFPGRHFEISLPSKNQYLQLRRILVPAS